MELKGKALKEFLSKVKPTGKPKVTMFKFTAKEIKKGDITRFKNLLIKLGVQIDILEMPKKMKGRTYDVVIIDEEVRWKK